MKAIGAAGSSKPAVWGCVALGIAGVFVTLGCLLAIYLEASGLGAAPRDGGMRPGYAVMLIFGAGAGILVPAAACRTALRASQRRIAVGAALAAAVVAIAMLGILGG